MIRKHLETSDTLIALTQAGTGQRLRVCAIAAGQELRARLCAMGLMPGMMIKVVARSSGPVILNVMGSRMALGHGMASRVRVKPLA